MNSFLPNYYTREMKDEGKYAAEREKKIKAKGKRVKDREMKEIID